MHKIWSHFMKKAHADFKKQDKEVETFMLNQQKRMDNLKGDMKKWDETTKLIRNK